MSFDSCLCVALQGGMDSRVAERQRVLLGHFKQVSWIAVAAGCGCESRNRAQASSRFLADGGRHCCDEPGTAGGVPCSFVWR